MNERSQGLAESIALLTSSRAARHSPSLVRDRTLKLLVADLIAARTAACMTQDEVAARMSTTKSVVCRLESGVRTRPTLRTIERYAPAVGVRVEIRVRAAL